MFWASPPFFDNVNHENIESGNYGVKLLKVNIGNLSQGVCSMPCYCNAFETIVENMLGWSNCLIKQSCPWLARILSKMPRTSWYTPSRTLSTSTNIRCFRIRSQTWYPTWHETKFPHIKHAEEDEVNLLPPNNPSIRTSKFKKYASSRAFTLNQSCIIKYELEIV